MCNFSGKKFLFPCDMYYWHKPRFFNTKLKFVSPALAFPGRPTARPTLDCHTMTPCAHPTMTTKPAPIGWGDESSLDPGKLGGFGTQTIKKPSDHSKWVPEVIKKVILCFFEISISPRSGSLKIAKWPSTDPSFLVIFVILRLAVHKNPRHSAREVRWSLADVFRLGDLAVGQFKLLLLGLYWASTGLLLGIH